MSDSSRFSLLTKSLLIRFAALWLLRFECVEIPVCKEVTPDEESWLWTVQGMVLPELFLLTVASRGEELKFFPEFIKAISSSSSLRFFSDCLTGRTGESFLLTPWNVCGGGLGRGGLATNRFVETWDGVVELPSLSSCKVSAGSVFSTILSVTWESGVHI